MTDIKVTLLDHMGTDLSVVNAARVSFDKESEWEEELDTLNSYKDYHVYRDILSQADTKLIKYLAKHKHISPFGHCFASFRVKAPVFVARQLVKHKFLRWNEVSRRYVDSEPEFYEPDVWRKRADNVKQGSSDYDIGTVYHMGEDKLWKPEHVNEIATKMYNSLLEAGCCPEQARMVLPASLITEWWWSGSLDAFADMCRLRLDSHSQKETQLVAKEIDKHMKELYPVSWEALLSTSDNIKEG